METDSSRSFGRTVALSFHWAGATAPGTTGAKGMHMHRKKIAAAAAVMAASAFAVVAPAGAVTATPPQPTVSYQGGAVVAHGNNVSLHITYRCTSIVSTANHLFAAVKEGPNVSP